MKVLPVLGKQDGVEEFWKDLVTLGVQEDYNNPQAIVVLGGDGTLLGAQRQYFKRNIPFIGVGFGRVNFLLNRNIGTAFQFYNKLRDARWKTFVDIGMRADITTDNGVQKAIAFNDIYIKSIDPTSVVLLELNTKEYMNEEVNGDGLIIASPQGSTAYNRNAGGTILPLGSRLWSVTGICTQKKLQATVLQQEVHIGILRGKAIVVTDNKAFRDVKEVRIVPSRYNTTICFDDRENFEQRRYS